MEESIDVKALRARFNSRANTSDTSSRDSGSPKSPRPGIGRLILPVTENNLANIRLSPTPPPSVVGPGPIRLPRIEPMAASIPSKSAVFPRPPLPSPAVRASIQTPADANKVKQKGEMLQNMMLMHQRPLGVKLPPAPAPSPVPATSSNITPLRQQSRQRSAGEVTPLRRALPPKAPEPMKPKRPPNVNLEPFMKSTRAPALPPSRSMNADSPGPLGRKMSVGVIGPPKPPERSIKPSRLPRQTASVDIVDDQDMYDDVGSFEKNESLSDNSSQCLDVEDDDVYEFIDEDQLEVSRVKPEKTNKKDAKKQRELEKKEQQERQKRENELRKNFQLEGEVDVIHTAKVRHDWSGGGKLDLSVRQGESVEIVRVKNNPGGKWLARTLTGNYGYISNTCVDIDYEAVKRKVLQARHKMDNLLLPPPPPDPPLMLNVGSNNTDSLTPEDTDYDDVDSMELIPNDFPPPPPEVSMDPKMEKELRKKFKYEGPIRVLHTMMVDPNGSIKKPGGKDLCVAQGDIVDVIEITNNKKALCRNRFGKYGYVSRSLLLTMEGDIYDDVDFAGDIYDNDSSQTDY